MLARRGRISEAIIAFESLDPDNHPSMAVWLSRLYVATHQDQRALDLLQKSFAAVPTDPNVLLQLINQTPDKKLANKYIQQASEAGLGEKVVKLLKQKVDGELDNDRIASIEKLINQEPDTFKRHTNRYRLYTGLGKAERADQELTELATLRPDDPLVVEAQFEQALKQHDWDAAEQFARRAAVDDLDLAQGSFYKGRLELAQGQAELAMVSFEHGLGKRSVYSRGWRDLADAQRAAGDMAIASASYRKALEQNPNNVNAVRGLVAALDAQARHEQALQELREMMLRGPQNAKLLDVYLAYEQKHGNPRRAMEIRKRLAEKNPNDSNNLRALAMMFAQHKNAQGALLLIDNLIAREGATRQNLFIKATVLNITGQAVQARQLLQDYVNGLGNKAEEDDWIILARFLMRAGETDRAIAAYRKGITLENGQLQNASRELADQLFILGKNEQAAALYGKMRLHDPKDQRIGYRHVEALIRAGQISEADSALSQIVRDYQPTAGAYLLASVIARQQNDPAKAIKALDNAAELEPNRAMVYFERAQVRRIIDPKDPQIYDDLQQAVTLDPELSQARRQLTALLLQQDNRSGAIQELMALKQRHPNDQTVRVQLAEIYYVDRQLMQLHALLDDSMRRFPNDAIWPRMQGRLARIENRSDLAVRSFQHAFKLSPTAPVLIELLEQLLETRHAQDALGLLREHEQLISNEPRVQALRGRALAVNGHTDQAKAVLVDAVNQCRNYKDVLNTSSQLLMALNREQGVIELDSLSASNNQLQPWIQMALAQNDIDHGFYESAVSRLHKIEQAAAGLSDGRVEYMRLLALALHKHGDYASALNNYAYLLAENLKRAKEALNPATHAAQLAPHNAQVLDTLGWVQHLAGMQTASINTLKRSVHLKPLANNYYHLAVALRSSDDFAQSRELLITARSLAQKQKNHELLELIGEGLNQ
jgi:tetratricopeptide (TPR) repeat protein